MIRSETVDQGVVAVAVRQRHGTPCRRVEYRRQQVRMPSVTRDPSFRHVRTNHDQGYARLDVGPSAGVGESAVLEERFAVVAGEVKELAQSTARATQDVADLVAAIQSDAGSVVEALTRIGEIVDRIGDTQAMIGGVLAEQATVTRGVLGG